MEIIHRGVGATLSPDGSVEDWASASGLNFEVEKRPVRFRTDEGKMRAVSGRCVLVRKDTQAPLDIVSDNYQPVQPSTVLRLFRRVVDTTSFTMDAAGILKGGTKIWAFARCDDPIQLPGNDRIDRGLLLATSYDRSLPTVIIQTSKRLFCDNQLPALMGRGGVEYPRLVFRHVSVFDQDQVIQQMALDEQWADFGALLGRLSQTPEPSTPRIRDYFRDVFYPENVRKSSTYSEKGANKRVKELMVLRTKSPGNDAESARGTVWGLVNAATYYVDHLARMRHSRPGDREDKNWFGMGAKTKERALQLALTLVPSDN